MHSLNFHFPHCVRVTTATYYSFGAIVRYQTIYWHLFKYHCPLPLVSSIHQHGFLRVFPCIRQEPMIQHKKAHMTRTSVFAHTSLLDKLISKKSQQKSVGDLPCQPVVYKSYYCVYVFINVSYTFLLRFFKNQFDQR